MFHRLPQAAPQTQAPGASDRLSACAAPFAVSSRLLPPNRLRRQLPPGRSCASWCSPQFAPGERWAPPSICGPVPPILSAAQFQRVVDSCEYQGRQKCETTIELAIKTTTVIPAKKRHPAKAGRTSIWCRSFPRRRNPCCAHSRSLFRLDDTLGPMLRRGSNIRVLAISTAFCVPSETGKVEALPVDGAGAFIYIRPTPGIRRNCFPHVWSAPVGCRG